MATADERRAFKIPDFFRDQKHFQTNALLGELYFWCTQAINYLEWALDVPDGKPVLAKQITKKRSTER